MPARLRPSKAERWVPCPGSVELEARYPEDETPNEAAQEGTAAHDAAMLILTGAVAPADLIGQRHENGVAFTDEMIDHVLTYVEAVNAYRPGEERLRYIEQHVSGYVIHEDCDGTADCAEYFPASKHLAITDLKYGWRIVEPFSNWQEVIYATAWCAQLGWKVDTISLRIVQPRPAHNKGPVREWNISVFELQEYAKKAQWSAVESINVENPIYKVGEWCLECRGRHDCEALQKATMMAVSVAMQSTPLVLNSDALGAELKLIRYAETLLKARISGLEAESEARLKKGERVSGFMLEPKYGNRTWNEDANLDFMGKLCGKDLFKKNPVTPAAAERLGVSKDVVKTMTHRPYTGLKLVEGDATERAKELFK